MGVTPKRCKDCDADWEKLREPKAPIDYRPRPAPYPGPRCATHDRAAKKASKTRAHATRVEKVYGITPSEWGRLYDAQGRVCFICRRANGTTRRLSVDHDHRTGLVRGLLCRPCNDLLGHLRDDPAAAYRIYAYLSNPPARDLGIIAVHEDNRKE
jgi:hypothetical protein